jgi:ABC-type transport system involved in multi-copper enzyme maturation permease subunit
MGRLLLAEVRKLRSMLQTWIIAGSGLVLTLFFVVLILVLARVTPESTETGIPPLETDEGVRTLVNQGTLILALVLVLGTLVMTSEYRHQTITSTFLAEPRRGRVLSAKFLVSGLVGLVLTGVTAALVVAVVLVGLAIVDVSVSDVRNLVVIPAVGLVLAGIGYALLGVAVGAVVRNQIAALVGALVWVMVIDPLIQGLLPDVGKYTPAGAASSLTNAVGFDTSGFDADAFLPMWAGGLLLLGYAVVLLVVASRLTVTRDVT